MNAETLAHDDTVESQEKDPRQRRRFGDLLKDLRDQTTTLLRQEVRLAQAETTEKVTLAVENAAKVAAGGFIAYTGLVLLLVGASLAAAVGFAALGLSSALATILGFLSVGLAIALIGGILVWRALRVFRRAELMPRQTVDTARETKDWVEEKLR